MTKPASDEQIITINGYLEASQAVPADLVEALLTRMQYAEANRDDALAAIRRAATPLRGFIEFQDALLALKRGSHD